MDYPQSTIALTLYNMLAKVRDVVPTAKGLVSHPIFTTQHSGVDLDQVQDALDALVERGYAKKRGFSYAVVDSERRVVISRNRDGDGWSDWIVRSHKNQLQRLEDELKGQS